MSMKPLSVALHDLQWLASRIPDLHAYRWLHFVKGSPKGERCRYALASERAFAIDDEEPKIRDLVADLRHVAARLEQGLALTSHKD